MCTVPLLALAAFASTPDFLLLPSKDTDDVLRFDAATGAFVDEFVRHKSGGLNQPVAAIVGPFDHDLYVSCGFYGGPGQKRAVLRYDGETGAFLGEFTEPGHLEKVNQILFGPDANGDGRMDLYVSNGIEYGPGMVERFDGTTGAYLDHFVAPSARLRGPRGMVFGPSLEDPSRTSLYLASGFLGIVSRFDVATGALLGELDPASAGLGYAVGVTFGPDGNLYVALNGYENAHSYGPNGVVRYQGPSGPNPGAFLGVFVQPGSGGLLDPSGGVLFGPDGNGDGHQDLYVTSLRWIASFEAKEHTSSVERFDGLTGAFLDTFVTPDSGGLAGPWLMAFGRTDPTTLAYLGD